MLVSQWMEDEEEGGGRRRRRRQWLEEVTWLAWDGMSGRGEFRDLHGSTAGLKNRLFQDRIYTFGCYLKSWESQSLKQWLLHEVL